MNQMHRGMLVAAMTAAFAMGCGGGGETPDGGGTGGCTSDSQCSTGKACHPVLKQCVESCSDDNDCPASAKTCATVSSSSSRFCTCSSDLLCNGNVTGNLVCNNATKQCTAKCSATSCPSGFMCNATSGNCESTTVADAGMECNDLNQCAFPEVCDFTAGKCKAGATCSGANPAPDTCGYAGYCATNGSGESCAQILKATCSNFPAVTFNPKTSDGAIIYYTEAGTARGNYCFKGFRTHAIKIHAYRTDRNWETFAAEQDYPNYVRSDGVSRKLDANSINSADWVSNAKELDVTVQLCATASTITAGFKFADGNEACADSTGVAGTANCTMNSQCAPLSCNTTTNTCE